MDNSSGHEWGVPGALNAERLNLMGQSRVLRRTMTSSSKLLLTLSKWSRERKSRKQEVMSLAEGRGGFKEKGAEMEET